MKNPDPLMQYLEICKAIFERMERDGTWPFPEDDSTESVDLIESENT